MKNTAFICLLCAAVAACSPKQQEQSSEEITASTAATATTVAEPVATTDSVAAAAQPAPAYAEFKFESQEYNFGTITAGKKVRHAYKFTNIGQVPLVISQVQPQCGCTAADYTKEPVPPGGQGEIVLEFDSQGREGQQNKLTTVFANVPGGSTILGMTGFVESLGDGRPLRRN